MAVEFDPVDFAEAAEDLEFENSAESVENFEADWLD